MELEREPPLHKLTSSQESDQQELWRENADSVETTPKVFNSYFGNRVPVVELLWLVCFGIPHSDAVILFMQCTDTATQTDDCPDCVDLRGRNRVLKNRWLGAKFKLEEFKKSIEGKFQFEGCGE